MSERFLTRLARGLGYAVKGGDAPSWFGPQAPLPPVAPPDVAGRQFDYPFGFNLALTPRSWEPTGFAELRGLAENYDLLRCVIETRKDQIERLSWQIRRRDGAVASAATDPRIASITAFFLRPDRIHSWTRWLRILLEDLLVIDAPTLYRRRTRGGQLWALEPLDGATIKRLIDDWGRTPAPPAPAYQQILKGVPAVDYMADELIYAPRNARAHKAYGFSPVEQVQMSVNIALRRQIYQLQYYTEGNIPEALIGVPDNWNPDQIRQFQAYWDSLNSGDTAERRHAKFVPGGVAKTFIPTREPVMKDIFDEWLARIICFAFSISPSAFIAQVNRATAETAQETALAEGLAPLQSWVKQLVDDVIATEFAAPDLEFAWADDRAIDPAQVAQIATSYVAAGIKSVNEVRAELGLAPVPRGDRPQTQVAKPTAVAKAGFDPDQPRDDDGRWTSGGGGDGDNAQTGGGNAASRSKPVQIADSGQIATDAQIAQEEDREREDEEPDSIGPVRAALYNSARGKLNAIDPSNDALKPFVANPGWTPSPNDVHNMQDALDRAIENHAEAAASYAYEKHVNVQEEFPDIGGQVQLQLLAQGVMRNSPAESIARGRIMFYQSKTNTLVILNPRNPEEDNIFRPDDGPDYVNRLRKGR